MSATKPSDKAGDDKALDDVRAEKKALRKEIRALLKVLTAEEIAEQSQKVWDKVVELPVYQNAKSVGLFLSMPKSEISTAPILRHCVAAQKDIYVPQVGQNFEKADMELRKVQYDKEDKAKDDDATTSKPLFYESWPKNKWNIPEPPGDMPLHIAKPGDIDLLIVPGLAFDHAGNRCGQGKGYYDRFIARMLPLPLVAVCLDCQLLPSTRRIPVQEYDQCMDMVLSPSHTIEKPATTKAADAAAAETGESPKKRQKVE